MGFHLRNVVSELGEGVGFGVELEGGQNGLMYLRGAPAGRFSSL